MIIYNEELKSEEEMDLIDNSLCIKNLIKTYGMLAATQARDVFCSESFKNEYRIIIFDYDSYSNYNYAISDELFSKETAMLIIKHLDEILQYKIEQYYMDNPSCELIPLKNFLEYAKEIIDQNISRLKDNIINEYIKEYEYYENQNKLDDFYDDFEDWFDAKYC
jgi:hypothetical protein